MEKVPGPLTCLSTWRRYVVCTGSDNKMKYFIKQKVSDIDSLGNLVQIPYLDYHSQFYLLAAT